MNLSKHTVSVLFTTLFVVTSFAQGIDNIPQKSEILKKIKLVNDYYLSGHSTPGNNQWVTSIYFTGCMEFYKIYPDKELLNYMNNWGEKNNWALGSSAANHGADQQVCGQTYIDLYNLDEIKNEIKIKAIKESIDDLIKNPIEAKDDWFWVDALYMAMPVFSKLKMTHISTKCTLCIKIQKIYENCMIQLTIYGSEMETLSKKVLMGKKYSGLEAMAGH